MKSLVEYIEEDGFHIKEDWNPVDGWSGEGMLRLMPEQKEILTHVFTPDENGMFPYTTAILSEIKKSGKTTILAAIGGWVGECGPAFNEAYSLANDEDQAQSRAFEDLRYHAMKRGLRPKVREINWPNGSFTKVLASEYRGAAGGRQFLTMWDELWGYTSEASRRLWAEMTPPPTVKSPLRVIVTYAGLEGESDLLWDLYEMAFLGGEVVPELAHIVDDKGEPVCRRSGRTFVMWDTVPRRPWQTDEYYEEQMTTLRPSDFLRLHRNQWVTSDEEFIPIKYWDNGMTLDGPLLYQPDSEYRQYPISIGVDAGIKNDCTAVVGTYYDVNRSKVGLAFHRIWTPNPEYPFDLNEVKKYIRDVSKLCNVNCIIYDPTQLHQVMMDLSKEGFRVREYPQTVANMTKATHALYDILKNGQFECYDADELREHIKFAKAEIKGRGMRLTKPTKRSRKKVDGAIALAMSVVDVLERGGTDTSEAIIIESPFGDFTGFKQKKKQMDESYLPEPLRS
jgi:phage terminase large subunit-like protein